MVIGDKVINDILNRLALKLGVSLDEDIKLNDIMKKVQNQNLNYQSHDVEIDVLEPCFKNGFFVRNCELEYKKDKRLNFNHEMVIGAKFLNKKTVQLKDLNGKKININHDVESGDFVKIKIKEVPLCTYMKLVN